METVLWVFSSAMVPPEAVALTIGVAGGFSGLVAYRTTGASYGVAAIFCGLIAGWLTATCYVGVSRSPTLAGFSYAAGLTAITSVLPALLGAGFGLWVGRREKRNGAKGTELSARKQPTILLTERPPLLLTVEAPSNKPAPSQVRSDAAPPVDVEASSNTPDIAQPAQLPPTVAPLAWLNTRKAVIVFSCLFGLTSVFVPPWMIQSGGVRRNLGYHLLFSPPHLAAEIDFDRLLVTWAAILLFSVVYWTTLVRSSRSGSSFVLVGAVLLFSGLPDALAQTRTVPTREYVSQEHRVAVSFPRSWELQPTKRNEVWIASGELRDVEAGCFVRVSIVPNLRLSTPEEFFAKTDEKAFEKLASIASPDVRVHLYDMAYLGGRKARRAIYSGTDEGIKTGSLMYQTLDADKVITVACFAEQKNFTHVYDQFDRIMSSFRFIR